MKSSKNQLLLAQQQIGNVGLPINNTAAYLTTGAFPNTTTLYGWKNGLAVNGGLALVKTGTIGQATDHSATTSECDFTSTGYYTVTDGSNLLAFTGTVSFGIWAYKADWAKPASSANAEALMSRWSSNGWLFSINATTTNLCFYINGGVPNAQCDVGHLASGWHFFQVVRDVGNTITKLFIDGVRVSTQALAGTITASGSACIGTRGDSTAAQFKGRLSDIWIHNATAWTDAQAQAIYAATAPSHTHTQAFAGHRQQIVEPNTTASEVLALYQWANASDLTIDAKGTYPLTVVGTPAQAESIFGDMGAVRFAGGGQALTSSTLLATNPTKGLWISLWVRAELYDTSPQFVLSKTMTSNVQDLYFQKTTTNTWNIEYNAKGATFMTPVRIGRWEKVDICWDTTNGFRAFMNGVLEASDPTATTLPTFNSTYPFQVGRYFTGSGANYFTGSVCDLKVMDKVPTQNDIDVAYASTFTKPTILRQVDMVINPLGDTTKQRRERIAIVNTDSTLAYRQGMSQVYGNYLPQADTEKRMALDCVGNSGQVCNTAVTDIPFILNSANPNIGTWDGSGFIPLVSCEYEFLGCIASNSSAGRMAIYMNGIIWKGVSSFPTAVTTRTFGATLKLIAGQRYSLRDDSNSFTLSNTSIYHWLSITRLNGLGIQPYTNNADTIQLRGSL